MELEVIVKEINFISLFFIKAKLSTLILEILLRIIS